MMANNQAGPRKTVQYGGTQITLLGTAHVSAASVEEVAQALATGQYDACAVELCEPRHARMMGAQDIAQLDLFQVIKSGKAGMVAANLALAAYQQRLADQLGVAPGAEMRMACTASADAGIPVLLIDREVGTTLRRVYRGLSWWRQMTLVSGLFAGLVSKDKVAEDEIERLKQGDILENTFSEFASRSPALYNALVDERDRYMAARLREEAAAHGFGHILVVIGAGHLEGIANYLERGDTAGDPQIIQRELEVIPPARSWGQYIAWAITLLVIAGFAIGFSRGTDLGMELVFRWIIFSGGLSALGAAIAWGHPLTILVSFVAAPLTTLNPAVGVGVFSAATEVYLRKPLVNDFDRLRDDFGTLKGWWRNRVTRALLVFMLSSIGSATGAYIAGFQIFERLVG